MPEPVPEEVLATLPPQLAMLAEVAATCTTEDFTSRELGEAAIAAGLKTASNPRVLVSHWAKRLKELGMKEVRRG